MSHFMSPLWKDFKCYLKHKRKEMTMEDLIVRLRIEEDKINSEKAGVVLMEAKTNIMEGNSLNPKGNSQKSKKFNKNFHRAKGKDFKRIKGS